MGNLLAGLVLHAIDPELSIGHGNQNQAGCHARVADVPAQQMSQTFENLLLSFFLVCDICWATFSVRFMWRSQIWGS